MPLVRCCLVGGVLLVGVLVTVACGDGSGGGSVEEGSVAVSRAESVPGGTADGRDNPDRADRGGI